jgi:hypothetical protein
MPVLDFNLAKRQSEIQHGTVDAADIRSRLHDDPRSFVEWLYSGRALIHKGEARIGDVLGTPGASLSIKLTGGDAGLWKDHATDQGGDLIELYRAWRGYTGNDDFVQSLKEIAKDFLGDNIEVERRAWRPTPSEKIEEDKVKLGTKPREDMIELGAPVATYKYFDTRRNIIASVVRYEPDGTRASKTFRPYCFKTINGEQKWRSGTPDGLRPLYRLPQIALASEVVLVEGEGCAEALAQLGIEATSAMQGAMAPIDKTDWTPLAGKKVTIWPDNDPPGLQYAKDVAAKLQSIGCTVLGITPPEGSPDKWDAADCVAEGGNAHALIEGALPIDDKAPAADPVDLWAKFDPPTLPRGILPDVIERFAFEQGSAMGADMAGIAVSVLAVCAAAIPDKIKLQVKRHDKGWRESARIWVALVGPPSSKKSPILAAAVRPLRRIDTELARKYAEAKVAYDALPKEEKAATRPPKQTRLLLQDTTIEAAQDVIKDSPDGVLTFHDELSGWFGSMDKYANARGAAKDRAFWLEAFNGNPYSVHRVGRGSVYIENLSASLIGGIQPEPIRKLANDSADDGLLQRLLPVILKPAVEGRDEEASEVVSEYAALIRRLHELDWRRGGGESGGAAMDFNDAPPQGGFVLRFDEKAQAYRQELERKHLELQSCESINRKLASHIGKYDGIFARLCVIWHCVEAKPGPLPLVISEEIAQRAGVFLHGFLLPHAMAFYAGVLGLSNDDDSLKAVAGYILTHKLDRVTNRDVQRGDGTMRKLDRQGIEAVLYQLNVLGWLNRVEGPRASSPPYWNVNPVVHVKYAQQAASEAERRARARKLLAEMFGGSA